MQLFGIRLSLVLISALLSVAVLPPSASTAPLAPEVPYSRLEEVVNQQIAMGRQVGVAIAVLDGSSEWVRGFGTTRLGGSEAPTARTRFEIGSVTKVFTSLLLADQVVRGEVSLTDPVSRFLPELAGRPAGTIELRELATHSSGLPRLPSNMMPASVHNPYADYGDAQLLQALHAFEFSPELPRGEYAYSNFGSGTLGTVLTHHAGRSSYEELLEERILRPMGLGSTRIRSTSEDRLEEAQGYRPVMEATSAWDFQALAGAGALRSNLADLIRFVRVQMNPKGHPLASTIRLTQQTHLVSPTRGNLGLGWFLSARPNGFLLWHTGQTGGFNSLVAFSPVESRAVIVLANTAAPVECILELVFAERACAPRTEHAHSASELQDIAGTYSFDGFGSIARLEVKNDYLVLAMDGAPRYRLFATARDQFDIEGMAQLTINRRGDGTIEGFVLTEGGQSFRATR